MKKAVKKYIFGFILLTLFCSPGVKAEDKKPGLNTAYYTVLETYLKAVSGGDSSINETFFKTSPDSSVFFTLLDIDGNGIQELFLANDLGEVIDAFTYKDGRTIRLLTENMGYRILGYLCEDGLLEMTGSSGAAYPRVEFYKIREDGRSCDMVELYKMDTDQGITELVDGSIVPCGPDDFFTYNELHGRMTVDWIFLSEENIQAAFDSVEGVDENWSKREIVQAPIFRMGACDNCWELLESYYLRQLKYRAEEEELKFDYRNYYYYEQDYNTDIQFIEISDVYSKWPCYFITVNTKTGEVKETGPGEEILRLNLTDEDIIPVSPVDKTKWYQPCLLEKEELYQKYADLIFQYEEHYGETTVFAVDEFRKQINGVSYLELIDFDYDGKEELLIAYNESDSADMAEYRFEIWGVSGDEIVMKDTGPLYISDEGTQTLKICELDGYPCVQNGIGDDFCSEYYHGYDGDGISIIYAGFIQEGDCACFYGIERDDADKETRDAEQTIESGDYTLDGTDNADEIIAKITETKKILSEAINSDILYPEQTGYLTTEQAEQGLSNYLAANYPTGRHYPMGEQPLDKYVVWAIYPTSAEEKLTVDLATGDVYAEGPYFGGGLVNEDFPVETRYLINVYDYLFEDISTDSVK